MQKKKMEKKARRRAEKHLERAWDAVAEGDFLRAEKEMERAVWERRDSALLFYDQGRIFQMRGKLEDAERALRHAVLLAPGYGDAYHALARVALEMGRPHQAVRLLEEAVRTEPESTEFHDALRRTRALAPRDPQPIPEEPPETESPPDPEFECELGLDRFDWNHLEAELRFKGVARLPGLLKRVRCEALIALRREPEIFEHEVPLEGRAGYGGGYRFLKAPVPAVVRDLRSAVYGRISPIANRWQVELGTAERFPPTHQSFLAECRRQGQERSTVLLLHYVAPAENALHQDIWGHLSISSSARRGVEPAVWCDEPRWF